MEEQVHGAPGGLRVPSWPPVARIRPGSEVKSASTYSMESDIHVDRLHTSGRPGSVASGRSCIVDSPSSGCGIHSRGKEAETDKGAYDEDAFEEEEEGEVEVSCSVEEATASARADQSRALLGTERGVQNTSASSVNEASFEEEPVAVGEYDDEAFEKSAQEPSEISVEEAAVTPPKEAVSPSAGSWDFSMNSNPQSVVAGSEPSVEAGPDAHGSNLDLDFQAIDAEMSAEDMSTLVGQLGVKALRSSPKSVGICLAANEEQALHSSPKPEGTSLPVDEDPAVQLCQKTLGNAHLCQNSFGTTSVLSADDSVALTKAHAAPPFHDVEAPGSEATELADVQWEAVRLSSQPEQRKEPSGPAASVTLEEELEMARQELRACQQEVSEVTASRATMEDDLKAAEQKLSVATEASAETGERRALLEKRLTAEGLELRRLESECAQQSKDVSEVTASRATMEDDLKAAEQKLSIATEAGAESCERRAHLEKRLAAEGVELRKLESECTQWSEAEASHSDLTAALAGARRELSAMQLASSDTGENLSRMEERLQEEQGATEKLEQMNEDLRVKWRKACEEVSEVTASRATTEDSLKAAERKLSVATEAGAETCEQRAHLKKRLAAEGLELQRLESECAQHLEEVSEVTASRATMEDNLKVAERKLSVAIEAGAETCEQRAHLEKHLAAEALELQRLESECAQQLEANASQSDLEAALAGARQELSALQLTSNNASKNLARLEERLQEEQQAKEKLERLNDDLHVKWRKANEEAFEVTASRSTMEGDLKAAERKLKANADLLKHKGQLEKRLAAESLELQRLESECLRQSKEQMTCEHLNEELREELLQVQEDAAEEQRTCEQSKEDLQVELLQVQEETSEAAASAARELSRSRSANLQAARAEALEVEEASRARSLHEALERARADAGDSAALLEERLAEAARAHSVALEAALASERGRWEAAEAEGEGLREARLFALEQAEAEAVAKAAELSAERRLLAEVQAESDSLTAEIAQRVTVMKEHLGREVQRRRQLQEEADALRIDVCNANAKGAELECELEIAQKALGDQRQAPRASWSSSSSSSSSPAGFSPTEEQRLCEQLNEALQEELLQVQEEASEEQRTCVLSNEALQEELLQVQEEASEDQRMWEQSNEALRKQLLHVQEEASEAAAEAGKRSAAAEARARASIDGLGQEQAALQAELDCVRQELCESRQAESEAEGRAAAERSRAAAQGRRLELMRLERAELATEANVRAAALQQALEEEREGGEELQRALETLRAERRAGKRELDAAERAHRAARAAATAASNQRAELEDRLAADDRQLEWLEAELADREEEASTRAATSHEALAAERRRRERLQREANELRSAARAAAARAAESAAAGAALEEDLVTSERELREAREVGAEAGHRAASAEGRLAVEGRRLGRLRAERTGLAEDAGARLAALREVLAAEQEAKEQLLQQFHSEQDALTAERCEATAEASKQTALAEERLEAQGQRLSHSQAECEELRAGHVATEGVLEQLREVEQSHTSLQVKLEAAEAAKDLEAARRSLLLRVHEDLQQALQQTEHHVARQAHELVEEESWASREQAEYAEVLRARTAALGQLRLAEREEAEAEAATQEGEARLADVRETLLQERSRRALVQLTQEESEALHKDAQEQVSAMEAAVLAAEAEVAAALGAGPPEVTRRPSRPSPGSRLPPAVSGSFDDSLDAAFTEPAVEPAPATLDPSRPSSRGRQVAGQSAASDSEDATPHCSWQPPAGSSNSLAAVLSDRDGAEAAKRRGTFKAALGDVVARALQACAAGVRQQEAEAEVQQSFALCNEEWQVERLRLQRKLQQQLEAHQPDSRRRKNEEWHAERCLLQGRIRQLASELRCSEARPCPQSPASPDIKRQTGQQGPQEEALGGAEEVVSQRRRSAQLREEWHLERCALQGEIRRLLEAQNAHASALHLLRESEDAKFRERSAQRSEEWGAERRALETEIRRLLATLKKRDAEARHREDQIGQMLNEQQAGLRELQKRHEVEQERERRQALRWRDEWEAERRQLLSELELQAGRSPGRALCEASGRALSQGAAPSRPCCSSIVQLKGDWEAKHHRLQEELREALGSPLLRRPRPPPLAESFPPSPEAGESARSEAESSCRGPVESRTPAGRKALLAQVRRSLAGSLPGGERGGGSAESRRGQSDPGQRAPAWSRSTVGEQRAGRAAEEASGGGGPAADGGVQGITPTGLAAAMCGRRALELEKVLAPLLAQRRPEATDSSMAEYVERAEEAVEAAAAAAPSCSRVRGCLQSALALSRTGGGSEAPGEERLYERPSWAERPTWAEQPVLPERRPAWGVGPGLRRPRSAGQLRNGWR